MIRNALRRIYSFNTIPVVFTALILRITVQGASIGDSIVALSVCGLLGFHLYLKSKRGEAPDLKLIRDVQQLKENFSAMNLAKGTKKESLSSNVTPGQRLF